MTPPDRVPGAVAEAPSAEARTPRAIGPDLTRRRPAFDPFPARLTGALRDISLGRLWLRDLLGIAVLAIVMRALFDHAVPWMDQTYALIWGRDMIHGVTPDLTYPPAVTAHPLANVLAAVAALLGKTGAVNALVVLSYLSLGTVLWGTYRLGEALFSRLVGVVAVLLVGSSTGVIGAGLSVYLDMPYLALVVWAAVLEVRKPRRGTSVVVLLTVAALLRPEAAVLAAAYWLYACRRSERRWTSALIVLVAPLGWVLMDLTATGHPFYTVSTQQLGGSRNPGRSDFSYARQFSAMLNALRVAIRGTALIGAPAGLLLALRLRLRGAVVPALIVALIFLTYGAFVLLGLAVPDRMLLTPGVMLALFCAFALAGWVGCPSIRERLAWAAVGIVVLALLLADAPRTISGLSALASRTAGQQRVLSDLNALSGSPDSRTVLQSCRPISIGGGGEVSYISYYLDQPLSAVGIAHHRTPTRGAYLAPTSWHAAELIVGGQGARQAIYVPPGFRRVAGNRSWNLYTKGC